MRRCGADGGQGAGSGARARAGFFEVDSGWSRGFGWGWLVGEGCGYGLLGSGVGEGEAGGLEGGGEGSFAA
ncbi:hypothetical protein GCM10027269_42770 [Kribbella endophytica]